VVINGWGVEEAEEARGMVAVGHREEVEEKEEERQVDADVVVEEVEVEDRG
jgi:hypothetical protein